MTVSVRVNAKHVTESVVSVAEVDASVKLGPGPPKRVVVSVSDAVSHGIFP